MPETEPQRKHPLAKCEECTLNDPDYAFVPTVVGTSGLAIVGEAPGYQEAKRGVPFSGPSGKLLDAVLANQGVERRGTTVTNVCLCRPPDNRTPSKKEIDCCSQRLKEDLSSATTIVALGNTAASAVLGRVVKITKDRVGPAKSSELYPNAQVIATFHPAACLRSADNFPYLVNDIAKIGGHKTVGWKEPIYKVYDDPAVALQVVRELERYSTLVIDIETEFDKDNDYQPSHLIDPICIGVSYESTKAVVFTKRVIQDRRWRDLFGSLLRRKKLVCHNGKYDLAWMQDISDGCKLYFDTMLASYCIDERPGTHGLDYLGIEILGSPDWKAAKKAYKSHLDFFQKDPDGFYRYNAYDCGTTYQLLEFYEKELANQNLRELHDFLVAASNELMHVEREGTAIDLNFLDELEEKYHRELLEAEERLNRWVNNPRSPKQVKAALEFLELDVEDTSKDTLMPLIKEMMGIPATMPIDDLLEFLPTLEHTDQSEFIWRMLDYRKEQKLYGTYIKGTRKRLYNGRVYPTFLLHGTTTGRLSCRNPNVQNIPRGSSIRNLFVPSEGNVFVQGDYSQAELRTIAVLSKDEYLRGVFAEGRDIHSEVAASFYGPDFTKENRVKAKMVVFGLSYDMSAFGLAWRMGIHETDAKKFIKTFFSMIPKVEQWRKELERKVFTEQDDLVTPFGRHRRLWLITKENADDVRRESLAFLPQSIASDICLSAFIKLRPMLSGSANLRITVHDSILAECAESDKDEVAATVKQVMEQSALDFTDYLPYKVDIGTGTKWGELE